MKAFSPLGFFILATVNIVVLLVRTKEKTPDDNLTCIQIEETRIVKMKGHLQFDQCYVVTADADENVMLHTVLCADTLKFNYAKTEY